MDDTKFIYPASVDFNETVTVNGNTLPRYGRRRQRAFRHLNDKAPFELDGSLFDRTNPLVVIMPTNVKIIPGSTTVSPTGLVKTGSNRLIYSHMPGVGAHGD